MDEETVDVALNEGDAPAEEPTAETEALDLDTEDTDSDAGDTGETVDEDDEEGHERGPIPYERFKAVNDGRKARDEALAKAGLRYDEETASVVPIAQEESGADDWDAEPEEAEPPEEAEAMPERAAPADPVTFAKAVIAATPEQIVEWAEENGYGEWTEAQAVDFKVSQREALRDHETHQRETAAREAQAKTGIGKALAEAGEDPYLSVCPEALNDLKETIKVARTRGVPYAQIEQDMEFLVGAAIKKHLPTLLERHGAKKVASASERRKTLVSQSPAQPAGAAKPAAPRLTADELAICREAGIDPAVYAARKEKSREDA